MPSTRLSQSPPVRGVDDLLPASGAPAGPETPLSLSLVTRLGEALQRERLSVLQWKGNWKQARWMSGEGDIDLLVAPEAETRLRALLGDLGFRRADPPAARHIPGTESHFGLDPATGRLIHLHVYFRLILGTPGRVMYHLPIETPLLKSATPGAVFFIPSAEFELVTFAVRMVQRISTVDVLRAGPPRWLPGIQGELDDLLRRAQRPALARILAEHLPSLDAPFIDACVGALRLQCSRWRRLRVRRKLHRLLQALARRPPLRHALSRWARRAAPFARDGSRNRVARGGSVVAIVGADGAGKTTCTREVGIWLSRAFAVMTAHLGRPPRSLFTLAIGGVLRFGETVGCYSADGTPRFRAAAYLVALRSICLARDRYRLYVRARCFAHAGGVALCERYPIPETPQFSGPRLGGLARHLRDTRIGRWLMAREAAYYERVLPPNQLVVLRVEPEIAVRRKTDEPPEYVRARGRIVWAVDWSANRAHVIDAGRSLPDVLADLKAVVWQGL